MLSTIDTVNTLHEDALHDAQMDYYGKRLATCSSDQTIKVFDVINGTYQLLTTLSGHEGAVWQVNWAHPKFGTILASCSYDKKVIIWKEESQGNWVKLYTHQVHDQSVNTVAFGPHEYGLNVVCGSSDGTISVISTGGNGSWFSERWVAHSGGCNSVSWAPACENGALVQPDAGHPIRRIVSGGCDNLVKVWKYNDSLQKWETEEPEFVLKRHDDWVRDVAWCPNLGLSGSIIASGGQDMKLYIWKREGDEAADWTCTSVGGFNDIIWRVSWSVTGHVLAVTCADEVSLWKEISDGSWQKIQANLNN